MTSTPRTYRLPLPEPRECACGCAIFIPMRDDNIYRTPACRSAVSHFKARRRAQYLVKQGTYGT